MMASRHFSLHQPDGDAMTLHTGVCDIMVKRGKRYQSSMKKNLTPEGCAVLYEDCLLRYRNCCEELEENNNSTGDGRRGVNDDDDDDVPLARLLLARTALTASLQHARQQSTTLYTEDLSGFGDEPSLKDDVSCLLEQTLTELEEDACQAAMVRAVTGPQHFTEATEELPSVIEDMNADHFFDEYPDWQRTDWKHQTESDDSDDGDDDEKDGGAPRKKWSSTSPTDQAKQRVAKENLPTGSNGQHEEIDLTGTAPLPLGAVPLPTQNCAAPPPPAPPPPPVNPYQQQQQRPSRTLPPVKSHQRASNGRNDTSWDDHCNQNPFQTAREYRQAAATEDNNRQQQQQIRQLPPPPQQQQQQQRGYNPYAQVNPYAEPRPPPYDPYAPTESPPPPKPVFRESLKRKFQRPTLGATRRNEQQGGTRKSGPSATSGQGGASVRPAGQKTANNINSEEDDLPEELKRFGKELVEKIENEIMESGDAITFDDIAGLEDQKQIVQEVVCWPMKRPDLFTGLRRAPNGLLLYGAPGTGKTLIGKAIAHESGATFFSISSSSLTSKWIGEGEKLVRTLFAVAAYRQPAVVFIDEIDSLLTQRKSDENEASRRIKTEFLVQLDGTGTSSQGRVLVIGATNRPQELDEAARRRFTKRLYIPLPDESDREALLRVMLGKNNHRLTDPDIHTLAAETEGFSGADLKALCTDAAMGPIRQLGTRALEVDVNDIPPISFKHFRQALRGMRPSVSPQDLVHYVEWDRLYGTKRTQAATEDDSDHDD